MSYSLAAKLNAIDFSLISVVNKHSYLNTRYEYFFYIFIGTTKLKTLHNEKGIIHTAAFDDKHK